MSTALRPEGPGIVVAPSGNHSHGSIGVATALSFSIALAVILTGCADAPDQQGQRSTTVAPAHSGADGVATLGEPSNWRQDWKRRGGSRSFPTDQPSSRRGSAEQSCEFLQRAAALRPWEPFPTWS